MSEQPGNQVEGGSRIDLFVFAPVFNEEGSIRQVLDEWILSLRRLGVSFTFLALDDGSRDRTAVLLEELRREFPELEVCGQRNRGHGPTCVAGYRRGIDSGAEWIFQIDSDGQCDPSYFGTFWQARTSAEAVFGFRKQRDDGWSRILVSRMLSLFVLGTAGVWVRDSNVPYRLIHRPILERALGCVPTDARFPNVLISIAISRETRPRWVPIRFRKRSAGTSTVTLGKMFHFAGVVYNEIRGLGRSLRQRAVA